jgi:hypothetical protein
MERFITRNPGEQFKSEYDFSDAEINDLILRQPGVVKVLQSGRVDLSTAGTVLLDEPGYGFVFYAYSATTGKKAPEVFIQVFVGQYDDTTLTAAFPAKTGRGFRGSFPRLFLKWPAQVADTYNVVGYIFKTHRMPWIGGIEAQ